MALMWLHFEWSDQICVHLSSLLHPPLAMNRLALLNSLSRAPFKIQGCASARVTYIWDEAPCFSLLLNAFSFVWVEICLADLSLKGEKFKISSVSLILEWLFVTSFLLAIMLSFLYQLVGPPNISLTLAKYVIMSFAMPKFGFIFSFVKITLNCQTLISAFCNFNHCKHWKKKLFVLRVFFNCQLTFLVFFFLPS